MLRIVEDIKIRNQRKEFVTNFANQYGYPIWDKVIIKLTPKIVQSFASNTSSVNDTTLLIPFALTNQNSVNGFIRAHLNDSILLSFSLAKDYKNYSFSNIATETTASQFALQIMILNKLAFGKSVYTIVDHRLFSNDTIHHKTTKITIQNPSTQNSLLSTSCWSIIMEFNVCTTPNHPDCVNAPAGCDLCTFPVCYNTSIVSTECPSSGGGNSGGGTTSGGSSTGSPTSGGGQIPYVYPCIPVTTPNFTGNSLTGDPLPPCPPPGGGSGWVPTPTDPCNPLITSLKTNVLFKQKFTDLMNNIPNPDDKETGEIIFNVNNNYAHVEGTAQSPGFTMINLMPHQAILHRHYSDLNDMFSHYDVWNMMARVAGNNVAVPNDYFWGMIGPYGQPYIIKVKDAAKIATYMQTANFDKFDIAYSEKFNYKFESQGNLNNKLNEIGFLDMLKKEGLSDAIELYRGNSYFNNWEKLGTNGRGVFTINCQ